MSLEALEWAFSQEVKPATRKLVLIALADYANQDDLAFPSLATLRERTSLDDKTVQIAVLDLIEQGYLLDTGARCGSTGQVRVLRLHGLPSRGFHYVYRLEHDDSGEFYIGCRSCLCAPDEDDYFGSGAWPHQMREAGVKLTKAIIGEFETRAEADTVEYKTIQQQRSNPLCKNKRVGTTFTSDLPPFLRKPRTTLTQLTTPRGKKPATHSSLPKTGTFPKAGSLNDPVFPSKGSRFSGETIPKTGYGSVREPSEEPKITPLPPKGGSSGRGRRLPGVGFEIPAELLTPELEVAWRDYERQRSQTRYPLTEESVKRLFAKLISFSPEIRVTCIDNAIEGSWRSFYPPRKDAERGRRPPSRSSIESMKHAGLDRENYPNRVTTNENKEAVEKFEKDQAAAAAKRIASGKPNPI